MTSTIFIYKDKGVGPLGYKALLLSLKKSPVASLYAIQTISAKELLKNSWRDHCACLIVPGGQDIPYHRALKDEGTQKIREYVESGGRYLGICAGAYFASSEIEFEKGKKHHVVDQRELCFFPNKAVGVIYEERPFCYRDEGSVHAALIKTSEDSFYTYYLGGCTFEKAEEIGAKVEVIAYYQDATIKEAPAIVLCHVGQGKALLSGIHFEIPSTFLSKNHPDFEKLNDDESKREKLFDDLLRNLLV